MVTGEFLEFSKDCYAELLCGFWGLLRCSKSCYAVARVSLRCPQSHYQVVKLFEELYCGY